MVGGRRPTCDNAVSVTTLPSLGIVYPPPPAYLGVPPMAPLQRRPQAGRAACGGHGGREEEHRRAWESIGEEERRLAERAPRIMERAARVV